METTIYCDLKATGQGIGSRLYSSLFEVLLGEDHRFAAGYALTNPAAAIHQRSGIKVVGVFTDNGRKR